jgi:3-phosphoshikimate 1-carboxyvinyltransferase
MRITGGATLSGARGKSYGDHRISMMLGVAGLLAAGETAITGAESARVTYPTFWDDLQSLSPAGDGLSPAGAIA